MGLGRLPLPPRHIFPNIVELSVFDFTGHFLASDIPSSPLRLSKLGISLVTVEPGPGHIAVPLSSVVNPQTLRLLKVFNIRLDNIALLSDYLGSFFNLQSLELEGYGDDSVALPADALFSLIHLCELALCEIDWNSVL